MATSIPSGPPNTNSTHQQQQNPHYKLDAPASESAKYKLEAPASESAKYKLEAPASESRYKLEAPASESPQARSTSE